MLISLLSNDDPVFAVDTIPFLADSYEDAEALWEGLARAVEERLAEDGLTLPLRRAMAGPGPLRQPGGDDVSDMAGVPFRAYNATTSRLAELMGAVPTQGRVRGDPPGVYPTGIRGGR